MEQRFRNIRLLLLDVDGVMTDGRIIYDNNGVETKAFDVKDGHGLKLLQRAGVKIGIITGRESKVVVHRARELGIDIVYQGAKDKLVPYREILENLGLSDDQVAYVGDDVVDLPVLRKVGFSATVADAVEDIKPYVDYVSTKSGGRGAVRDVCDYLLKRSGNWGLVTDRYFGDLK
jgi:3-deoxy-D-manno-octulosonate 8-phosphate phosphatase (KDO 8-P phosphatase)